MFENLMTSHAPDHLDYTRKHIAVIFCYQLYELFDSLTLLHSQFDGYLDIICVLC